MFRNASLPTKTSNNFSTHPTIGLPVEQAFVSGTCLQKEKRPSWVTWAAKPPLPRSHQPDAPLKTSTASYAQRFRPIVSFPPRHAEIQQFIGNENACAFDVSAACAGFVYALSIADAMIASGRCNRMLVVGAEITSRTVDWTDRSTCVLFGDAAGAVLLEANEGSNRGILSTYLNSNGTLGDILCLPAVGEKRFMKMNGNEVYKHAVRLMGEATEICLAKAGFGFDKVDLLIPHQANIRIINAMAKHMNLPREKVVTNLDKYGNTSSASIPLALEEAWKDGRIKDDTVAVFTALGGGLVWGSAVVRF